MLIGVVFESIGLLSVHEVSIFEASFQPISVKYVFSMVTISLGSLVTLLFSAIQ